MIRDTTPPNAESRMLSADELHARYIDLKRKVDQIKGIALSSMDEVAFCKQGTIRDTAINRFNEILKLTIIK